MIRAFIKNKINDKLYDSASKQGKSAFFKEFESNDLPNLSEHELYEINNKWAKIVKKPSYGYKTYSIFKKFNKFNVDFIPESYFYPYILRSLNPMDSYISLSHKGLIDEIFKGLSTPKSILYKFKSNIVDSCYHPVSVEDIEQIITKQHGDLLLKPTLDSNSGKGIRFYNESEYKILLHDFLNHTGDCVIQKNLSQSSFTAQFNPTSLNTFRIITLYINNKCSICCFILKLGAQGKRVDNGVQGAVWVNVENNGYLCDYGWDLSGRKWEEHNHIGFKDKQVPNFEKIKEFVIEAHYRFPMLGIVGWDIALDNHNEPVLIEGNLWWPSVSYPQLLTRKPFFGDRTQEVIDYVLSHKPADLWHRPKI